ncbi:MAG: Uma2 family endonuclease, partial [Planctomycetes bacterium]|nr:Uma2 family endonuclease [Planctomycetota bacterium]
MVTFVTGGLIVDMSLERLDTHNLIKTEITVVLASLIKKQNSGYYCSDRVLLSNLAAHLSTEPDSMFVSRESLKNKRAEFVPLTVRKQDSMEVLGSPDWVLEIVSPSSIKKDKVLLRKAY